MRPATSCLHCLIGACDCFVCCVFASLLSPALGPHAQPVLAPFFSKCVQGRPALLCWRVGTKALSC
jgi:hypothetical protein